MLLRNEVLLQPLVGAHETNECGWMSWDCPIVIGEVANQNQLLLNGWWLAEHSTIDKDSESIKNRMLLAANKRA
jgi:hypothetical protein